MCSFDEYYEYLLKKNRKKDSVDVYKARINTCIRLLKEAGMETEPGKIGEDDFWFLVSNSGMKEGTVKANVQALNRALKHLTKKDQLTDMDILWNRPYIERVFISSEEFNKMYKVAEPKERMILMLGAAMGLRRSEIWSVNLKDIHNNKLTIRGKGHGNNGYVVRMMIPQAVIKEIESYDVWRSDYFGNDLSGGRLIVYKDVDDNLRPYKDSNSIWSAVNRLAKKADVRATTHSLRRLFCTELDRINCKPMVMQDLMRHSNMELLKIYIQPNEKESSTELERMTSELVKL